MSLSRLGVVGAGIMGSGIAQVSASSGLEVVILEICKATLRRALKSIGTGLDHLVKSQTISKAQREAAWARIRSTTAYTEFAGCDLVIEAATEDLATKRAILRQADQGLRSGAILATNTSSLSITTLAAGLTHPERFIGIHFFNPVPAMPLVELIGGLQTSEVTRSAAASFVEILGKTAINAKNTPGFAVNRILCPMINEAIFALQEGIASARHIDQAMTLGCRHPMGPLALADLIGLDTLLAILEGFQRDFGDSKYRPAPLLREFVAAGRLGRKSGHGFFSYP